VDGVNTLNSEMKNPHDRLEMVKRHSLLFIGLIDPEPHATIAALPVIQFSDKHMQSILL
jgi:hypothetical protein